jgi:hypothetical protein
MSALSRPSVFTSETTAVRPCKLKLKRGAGAIVEITSLASLHHTARQRTAFAGDPGQTTGNDTRMSLGSLDAIAGYPTQAQGRRLDYAFRDAPAQNLKLKAAPSVCLAKIKLGCRPRLF